MPKLVMNYDNAVIYKIVCNDLTITDSYVGSTTNFTKRKCGHKNNCENNKLIKVYQVIIANGNWNNWSMILVEEFPTTSKLLLEQRERHWIETLGATLNCILPTRTHKEWRDTHKEHVAARGKQYDINNKDKIKDRKALYYQDNKEEKLQYYQDNKDKIKKIKDQYYQKTKSYVTCECGCIVLKQCFKQHQQTDKHIEAMETKI
jgi:hypothetical protein